MIFFVVLVVAVFLFLMFWYIIIPAIAIFVIWLWWTGKPQIACPGCDKKYRRKGGLADHMETCDTYQYRIKEEERRAEEGAGKEEN